MKDRIDIHQLHHRYQVSLNGLDRTGLVSSENKEAIRRFLEDAESEGVGVARRCTYVYWLKHLATLFHKNFTDATVEDVRRVVMEVERSGYSEWTKNTIKVMLKRFYKQLWGTDEFPAEVKWLRTTMKNHQRILPEEILTEQEVWKLAEATESPRDRALILTLYESGCRIGELLPLRVRNVQFDNYGAVLIVAGKTGMRRVRIIVSVPALSEWLATHPKKAEPASPLWVLTGNTNHGMPMTYPATVKMLRHTAKKAGLKKAVNPHMFRHSRASHLATKLTEQQMKQYLGWTPGSDMAAVYVHLSGRDVDKTLLQIHGLERIDEEPETIMKIQICPRCETKNDPVSRFCHRCRLPSLVAVSFPKAGRRKTGLSREPRPTGFPQRQTSGEAMRPPVVSPSSARICAHFAPDFLDSALFERELEKLGPKGGALHR